MTTRFLVSAPPSAVPEARTLQLLEEFVTGCEMVAHREGNVLHVTKSRGGNPANRKWTRLAFRCVQSGTFQVSLASSSQVKVVQRVQLSKLLMLLPIGAIFLGALLLQHAPRIGSLVALLSLLGLGSTLLAIQSAPRTYLVARLNTRLNLTEN